MGVAALVLPVTLFELAFLRYVSLFVLCVCSSLTIFVPVMSRELASAVSRTSRVSA